jgi:hypothetical protein
MAFNRVGFTLFLLIGLQSYQSLSGQDIKVASPNQAITVAILSPRSPASLWSLSVNYKQSIAALPEIELGLIRSDGDFGHQLKLNGKSDVKAVHESYVMLHGKKSRASNYGNEVTIHFINPNHQNLDVILRVYNDGVAFRYAFPEKKSGTHQ